MTYAGGLLGSAGDRVARLILAVAGAAAMVWATVVFPTFSSEIAIVNVASAVAVGEVFKPDVLASIDARIESNTDWKVRPSVLGKAAVIRLRLAENIIRTGDTKRIDRSLESLSRIIDASLLNAPSDPFLWLARFWLDNVVNGFRPDHLRDLRMSYDLGRFEGWIAIKRNRLALAYYSVMSNDLAELAVSEFVGLVRWGFAGEAADIAAGPGRQLRTILFPRLKDLIVDQRRIFAQGVYGQDLDDVPVPGISPPKPQIPMPALPQGF
jgi:hypothetical protein